jgi:hypothetical protein
MSEGIKVARGHAQFFGSYIFLGTGDMVGVVCIHRKVINQNQKGSMTMLHSE